MQKLVIALALAGSAAAARAEPAPTDGGHLHLIGGPAFTLSEVFPAVMALVSYRFGSVSVEAGLASFDVRVDAQAGLRFYAAGDAYFAARVSKMLFATLDEVSDDPIVMLTAGNDFRIGHRWSLSAELGALWILEQGPDMAFVALLGVGCRL